MPGIFISNRDLFNRQVIVAVYLIRINRMNVVDARISRVMLDKLNIYIDDIGF